MRARDFLHGDRGGGHSGREGNSNFRNRHYLACGDLAISRKVALPGCVDVDRILVVWVVGKTRKAVGFVRLFRQLDVLGA